MTDPGPTVNVTDPAQPDSVHCIPVEMIRRIAFGEIAPSDVEDQRVIRCLAALALERVVDLGPKCAGCDYPCPNGADLCDVCADIQRGEP